MDAFHLFLNLVLLVFLLILGVLIGLISSVLFDGDLSRSCALSGVICGFLGRWIEKRVTFV